MLGLIIVFLAVFGTLFYIGFQNSANAAPEQVDFNPVTIRNGAKIHVNGDKSLTAIDNGKILVADNTSSNKVKGDAIASSLSSFADENYGTDALFKTGTASNPKSLSEAHINSFRSYLPTVNNDYWLSDTSSKYGFDLIAVASRKNTKLSIVKALTGKTPDGSCLHGLETSFGSYDLKQDYLLGDFLQPTGTYIWSLDSESEVNMYDFETNEDHVLDEGDEVYNNPFCIEDHSRGFYKSTIHPAGDYVSFITGCVQINDGSVFVRQVKITDAFQEGDILYYSTRGRMSDETGFRRASDGWKNIYFKAKKSLTLKRPWSIRSSTVRGLYSGTEEQLDVKGQLCEGGKYAVLPVFNFSSSDVAFARDKTSGATLPTSSSFGYVPSADVGQGEEKKVVVKSDNTTISNAINDTKISTDNSANGHANITFSNGIIKVPFGAKTLTLNSSAFTSSNANYISALANAYSTQEYTVLGKAGQNLEINLESIVSTTQIGSTASVSFYAEQANYALNSDGISKTPVTVQIEVVEGPEQTIKYDDGGGTGTLPASAIVRAGKSYALADGSGLSKDGNLFSRWQLTYTPYGETEEITRFVKGNEPIIVPDTEYGKITATALFSGITSAKMTKSKPSVVTITWDTNAPEGYSATFNDGSTHRNDKIKILGSSLAVPEKPNLNTSDWVFVGWYLSPNPSESDIGYGVGMSVPVETNATYYAHWIMLVSTFLGPSKGNVANPLTISGTKYSIAQVKEAASEISNSPSSSYYSQYTAWMNDDSYHLYTLLNGKDASLADSWVEFRIVNVGPKDNDGTGLTFQAVHLLPTAYQMNSTDTSTGGWASCALKKKMQSGGDIYNLFDTQLTSKTVKVSTGSKGNLWIASFSELTGESMPSSVKDGEQFAYWKATGEDLLDDNWYLRIKGTRSGGEVESAYYSGYWWERTPSGLSSGDFFAVGNRGNPCYTAVASRFYCVVPCFSL